MIYDDRYVNAKCGIVYQIICICDDGDMEGREGKELTPHKIYNDQF